jgi:hypothetical protein
MKTKYSGLWALLTVAFVVVVVASAFDSVSICGHELKTSGIISRLTEPRTPACQQVTADSVAADTVADSAVGRPAAVPVDTAAQRILLIGDSMLEGLSPRLAAYAGHNGHELYTVIWYSSTSQIWGECDTLSTFIRRYRPTYVMVCLGSNELFVRDIERKRDRYVKRLLRQIGDLPYLWIGPPNWKADTGINSLLAKNVASGAFFLSDGMHFERKADGAHPTSQAAALWVDSIARWMPEHSCHPILMNHPSVESARPRRVVVLQPKKKI